MQSVQNTNSMSLELIAGLLAKMAEKSTSVYWLSSPDFQRIAYISPAFDEIWGRPREILYKTPEEWINYLHPDDVNSYHPIHAMAEKIERFGGDARYDESYRIVRPDGEVRYIIDRGFPIIDGNGVCQGVTGVAVDITKEKLAEEALRKAKEEAEEANQIRTVFIRNMEHDIRTPFNGIWGMANILAERETNTEKRETLTEIANCAKELLDYCNDVLDFSRVESCSFPILSKSFNLKELIDGVIAMETPPARQKQLNLSLDFGDDIPVVVKGDPYRLQRVLINLVSNAIKFTGQGDVTLAIKSIRQVGTREVIIRFIVKDTGVGIPQEKQNMIYEHFTRLDPANKGLYRGSGLGLYIVRQFMDEMDGDINVVSETGVGTSFTCTLAFKLPLTDDIIDN